MMYFIEKQFAEIDRIYERNKGYVYTKRRNHLLKRLAIFYEKRQLKEPEFTITLKSRL